jgi:aryl-alcohol dehydrogenase-like predicted oxidoreductase
MRFNRVGTSGLEVSELGLGTFEWGHRVSPETAQDLVEAYCAAGGTIVEISSFSSPAAEIVGTLELPPEIALIGRVGVVVRGGAARLSCGRATILRQVRELLLRTNRDRIEVLVLDGFDARTPLDETASALRTLIEGGQVVHVGAAHHTGWQLAALRGAGIPVIAAVNELSLLDRSAEAEVLPAADYLGLGVFAGAALGRGILTGKYARGVPRDSRASGGNRDWVVELLTDSARHTVAGITKAAAGLGVEPLDVALAWNRALPVASSLVSPRSVAQLEQILRSDLVLEPEIRDALDQISDPYVPSR